MRDLDQFEKMARKNWNLEQKFGITPQNKYHVDITANRRLDENSVSALEMVNSLWKDPELPLNAKLFYIFQFGRFYQSLIHNGAVPKTYVGRVTKALLSFNSKYNKQ